MATFTTVGSSSGTYLAKLSSSASSSPKLYNGNLHGEDLYKKKMLREFADVDKKVFRRDIDENLNLLPVGLEAHARRPKVELIEDNGNLDALFKQIRQQNDHREGEKREKAMSGTRNRVNIPKAFTEKGNTTTDTGLVSVPKGVLVRYDNVSLHSSPTEQNIILGKENNARDATQQLLSAPTRDFQSKRVSFHASVGASDEEEDTSPDYVSRATSFLDQCNLTHLPSDASFPRNKTDNMFAPSYRPERVINQRPPEDGLDESCRKLNKLENLAEVPATYHKLSNSATIDLNNLAPENNDVNSINKPGYFSSTHLYPAATGRSPDDLCQSKVELLPTTKTKFNGKTTPPSIVDQIQSIKLNGGTRIPFKSKDNVAIARFNSKVSGQHFTSAPSDEVAVISDLLRNTTLELNCGLISGKTHTVTEEGKARTRPIGAGDTKFASNSFVTADSLKSLQASLGKGVSSIPSNFPKGNARSLPQFTNQQHIEGKKGSSYSSGTAHYSDHSKPSQPKSFVLRRNNESLSTLAMEGNMMSSSLKETRALFERADMDSQGAQGATTIRKVGKLNIRQGFDARSSHTIKERHGEAPSNVSIKMKQQLEDVLQSRSSEQSTPHESRKGSRQETESFSNKSPRQESLAMAGGLTFIDRINYEMSGDAKQFKRSDSGTSEESSRGSIKQELEGIFGGKKSSENHEPVRSLVQKEQRKDVVTRLPNAEIENGVFGSSPQKFKNNFVNDYQQKMDFTAKEESIRPTRDLKAIFEQKKTVSQPTISMHREMISKKTVTTKPDFEAVQWKADDSDQKSIKSLSTFQDQEVIKNRPNESVVYSTNREEKENPQYTEMEVFANREDVIADQRERAVREKGFSKLNIPGVFQSSYFSTTPEPSKKIAANRKQATKAQTESNSMIVEHQSSYNNAATSVGHSARDFTNDLTPLMHSNENKLRSINELPVDDMSGAKKMEDKDNESTLDDVNQLQVDEKTEIFPSRTVGKLNMHNFSLFGNKTQSYDAAPRSRTRSKTNWWQEQHMKTHVDDTGEQSKVRHAEQGSDHSKAIAEKEPPSAIEVSNTGIDFFQVDLSVHNFPASTSPSTVPSKGQLRSGQENKPQSSYSSDTASGQSLEARAPSNPRRGKLSIPAAFATQKSEDKTPATTRFSSKVSKQSFAYQKEWKTADPVVIKSETNNAQNIGVKKYHLSQDSLDFDNLQPSNTAVVTTKASEDFDLHLVNNAVDIQATQSFQGPQHPTNIPQRESVGKFGPFKETQSSFTAATFQLETPQENVFQNSKNGGSNSSEKLVENYDIPSHKVGRLAIPGVFGEVKTKPMKSRSPLKSVYGSEPPSTAVVPLEENLSNLANGPNDFSKLGQAFQDLPEKSSPEVLFVTDSDHCIETKDKGADASSESSKDDERSGFISPRRGNFNRNRFIGKISVPSAFQ